MMNPAKSKFIGGMVQRLRGRNAIKGAAKAGARAGAIGNMMKRLDPASAIRESEARMIRGAAKGAAMGGKYFR